MWTIAALLVLWGAAPHNLMAQNVISGECCAPKAQALKAVERATKPLYVDMNDYYYLSNGEIASFLRSKNTYLLFQAKRYTTIQKLSESIETQFAGQVGIVSKHAFGHQVVIEVKDDQKKENIISRIYERYPTISYISPLMKSKKMGTGLAVLPQIVVRISADADPQESIELLQSNNLNLVSKLKFTESEFIFEITETINDVGRIFEITREIAHLPYVDWAEPNFIAKPQKMFTPNDPLYNQQWHLNNTGQNNALVDADVDAPEGWNLSKGNGTVIAIYDDGVQLNHPDLRIWSNPGESGNGKENNGFDDDGNGYTDDFQGWDFRDNDNNPDTTDPDDRHGTAVAGVAGAKGNNGLGVSGSAMDAVILPLRMNFEAPSPCSDWADAMRYAGKYADVVNNSWGGGSCTNLLDSAIYDVVNGEIPGARRGTKGVPVVFAAGNSASGWVKFTLSGIPAGTHQYRWRFYKDSSLLEGYDTVWLDNISFPDGGIVNFESDTIGNIPNGFTSGGNATWSVVSDGVHARGASGKSVKAGTITDSQETNLYITYTNTVNGGTLTYWAWVSSEQGWDWFEFYWGGQRWHRFSPGQGGHSNEVSYPASNPDTIAVGGTNDGSPGDVEERTHYSQFGPQVDVVACTSGLNAQGITTTDRTGPDGYNPPPYQDPPPPPDLSDTNYTKYFGGTSSAAPLVSGIVANIIAYMPNLTAVQIRDILQNGADKIGPYSYPIGRNDFYGYGRVNLYATLQLLAGNGGNIVPVNFLLIGY